MEEQWRLIENFDGYSISNLGRVRTDKTERILRQNENQFGLLQVGMMRDGVQYHRSVPLLVAKAFIFESRVPFNTPINLDGDRHNNQVDNLAWRPRWFARRYNRQFRYPYANPIMDPIIDLKSRDVYENSWDCAQKNGLLHDDLVLSILNRTYVWPTYQEFDIYEE
jgi:hypothetical protein